MSRSGRLSGAGVAAVLCAVVATACATEVPSRSELVAAFESSGLSADLAGCVTDAVLENLPDEDVIRLVERGAGAGPRDDPDRDDDPYDRTRAALTACQEAAAATSTTSTTAEASIPADAPTTTAPADGTNRSDGNDGSEPEATAG